MSPQFDFSQFHPLDHRPWSKRCGLLPGGWRRHVQLAWNYKVKLVVAWWAWMPLYVVVLCPLGKHRQTVWWSQNEGYWSVCDYCDHKQPATEAEFEEQ